MPLYGLIDGALFQSTLSSRRATGRVLLGPHRQDISIHALLTESDIFNCVNIFCA